MYKTVGRLKRSLFLSFIIGIVVFAALLFFADIQNVKTLFSGMNVKLLPVILLLAPLNYLLRYVKWNFFLKQLNLYPDPEVNKYIFLSGLSMTVTPGKVGELLKCYLLKEHMDTPISVTSPIVMAERLTDAMAMILLASLGALAYDYGRYVLLTTALALIVFVLILQSEALFGRFTSFLGRISVLKRATDFLSTFQQASKALFTIPSLLYAVGIGVISWGFEGLIIFFTIQALGGNITILSSLFVVSLSAILGALSFIPGGLGVAEGSILGILILTGIEKEVAAASTVITRFSTLWLGVMIGIYGLIRVEKMIFKT